MYFDVFSPLKALSLPHEGCSKVGCALYNVSASLRLHSPVSWVTRRTQALLKAVVMLLSKTGGSSIPSEETVAETIDLAAEDTWGCATAMVARQAVKPARASLRWVFCNSMVGNWDNKDLREFWKNDFVLCFSEDSGSTPWEAASLNRSIRSPNQP